MQMNKLAGVYLPLMAATVLLATVVAAPSAQARQSTQMDEEFGKWSALGGGYVARRREPPRAALDKSERRLDSTQQKVIVKKSHKDKNNRQEIETSVGVYSSQAVSQVAVSSVQLGSEKAPSQLWFYTTQEGLHSVAVEDIAQTMLLDSTKVRKKLSRGKLTLNSAGKPVAWRFDAESDALVFVAERYQTLDTDANAYSFTVGGKNKQNLKIGNSGKANKGPKSTGDAMSFRDSLVFEEEPDFSFMMGPMADEPDADYWFWDAIFAGYPGSDSIEHPLYIPDPAFNGTAQIRVNLRGASNIVDGDDHLVYAELNGVAIGSPISFDAFEAAQLVADVDQGLLDPAGNNVLRLYNSAPAGAHPMQALDKIEVDYSRLPVAIAGSVWVHNAGAGVQQVSGFASADVLVVENPTGTGKVKLRRNILVEDDGLGGYQVSFRSAGGSDFLVSERSAYQRASIAGDIPSELRSPDNAARYLIIAPRVFSQTAAALADYRSARFGQVQIAWLEDIYDEFSAGREDPAALAAFMDYALANWGVPPGYVTLLGKGTLDHKDRMGYGDSFIPVAMTSTPWSLASSDDALLGLDGNPAVAVGRVPMTNDLEGLDYVLKLQGYDNSFPGTELYEAVLVADNNDGGGNFQQNSDVLSASLLESLGFTWLDKYYHPMPAPDTVRSFMVQSATWNRGYVGYDGHGSTQRLGDRNENFFGSADAAALQNTTLPIFTALTCAAGSDVTPGWRSVAGALVLNPQGGAIAAMSPTGLSFDSHAQVLGSAFVESLFGGNNTIGDAVRDAKVEATGAVPTFMPHIYTVVGDPAVYAR